MKVARVNLNKIYLQKINFIASQSPRVMIVCHNSQGVRTNDIVDDVKQLYLEEFEQARIEYNQKQTREDRKIIDYLKKVCESQNDIACEIIIELGDMDFWNDKDERYKFKMVDVYNEQIKDLTKIVPDFKIANATIHFDETSPHIHIVGVPIIENCTRGMKKQVGKVNYLPKRYLLKYKIK